MRIRLALMPLLAFSLNGCGTEIDLNGKSDVELCVEAHLALEAAREPYIKANTATNEQTGEKLKWNEDYEVWAPLEAVQIYEDAKNKAAYYLVCLSASRGG